MGLTRLALDNSRALVLFLVFVIGTGTAIFLSYPSAEDPTIQIRNVAITAPAPGLNPLEMETLIARPLEEAIRDIPAIAGIDTTVRRDVALLDVEVADTVPDVGAAVQEVRNRLSRVEKTLPSQSLGVFVEEDIGLVAVATVALWSDGFSKQAMADAADKVVARLYALDGVRKVAEYGEQERRIFIEFDPDRASEIGLDPRVPLQALVAQNAVAPTGSALVDGLSFVVEPTGDLVDAADIAAVQFQVPGSSEFLTIGDIADVSEGFADPPSNPVIFNGRQAIAIAVSTHAGVDNVAFGETLTAAVDDLRYELPIGLELDFASYQPELIEEAVGGAISNVFQTLAIVLVVVMLFLGLRAGLIVGAFVPLTMILGLIVMSLLEVELQRMSIAATIIALGLLVDNGIVIAEDVKGRMLRGVAPRTAAIEAGRTLAIPLLTSSLTTVAAFLPIVLIAGAAGEFVRSLGVVVIILLLTSWFLSLTVTPALCAWFLKVAPLENARVRIELDDFKGAVAMAYRRILELLLGMRVAFLVAVVALLVVSVFGLKTLRSEFFPLGARSQFLVYLDLEAGTDIRTTEAAAIRLTDWLSDARANPEIRSNIAYVGEGGPRFFLSLTPMQQASNRAFVLVNVESSDQVDAVLRRTNAFIDANLTNVRGDAKTMWFGATEPGLVKIRIVGPDPARLLAAAQKVEAAFYAQPDAAGVKQDWENRVLELELTVDQARARRAGVTSSDLATALRATFNGFEVTSIRGGDDDVPVIVRARETARNGLAAIANTRVWSSRDQRFVRLGEIAVPTPRTAYPSIHRSNLERVLTIEGRSSIGSKKLVEALGPTLAELDLPEGYRVEVGGEPEDQAKAQGRLYENFPFALAIIAILLIAQFNSVRRGGIILMTIPLVLVGAVLGLLVMNAAFGFMVLLGFVSLAGIVINNGIVLIDKIVEEEREGRPQKEAILVSCLSRLRPILMTTLTTTLGLVPLILFGGALFYGMASAIAFGLIVASALTLGVVPVLYSLLIPERTQDGRPSIAAEAAAAG